MVSVGSERGLANCPAMRPTFTTGLPPAKVSTTAICRIRRKVSRMLSAENSLKLSAQSPPCKRNALPAATSARRLRSESQHDRHLQDQTKGVADVVGGEFLEALGAITSL